MPFDPFGLFSLFKAAPEPLPSDLPDVRDLPDEGDADQTPAPDLDEYEED